MYLNKDFIHALSFFSLYIYTIFAQIGYVLFPELSSLYGAYFGEKIFYRYWLFMFLSFYSAYTLYIFINSRNRVFYSVKKLRKSFGVYIFFTVSIILLIFLFLYFIMNRGLFGYGGGETMGGAYFGIGFLILHPIIIILYSSYRERISHISIRIIALILFILSVALFLQVSIAAGSRSGILYVFVSIAYYELTPLTGHKTKRRRKRKVPYIVLAFGLVLVLLSNLRLERQGSGDSSLNSLVSIKKENNFGRINDYAIELLSQDYYLPSHTLFVSMHYGIIDPVEVLKSNMANSLFGLNYPFLSNTILERGLGYKNERGVGWAYHFFVEGYNTLGFFGFIYNAVLWNILTLLWVKLSNSNDALHNKSMKAILALLTPLVIKGQTSSYIRFYWLVLLPAVILLLLANNKTFVKRLK